MNGMRRLHLETTYNTRDLGGYLTQSGAVTSYKQFLRSDDISYLNENDVETLFNYGVRTVIDLRGVEERQRTDYTLEGNSRISMLHLPLYGGNLQELREIDASIDGMSFQEAFYIQLLEEKETLTQVLRAILEAPEGGILFHCMAGKDRTGIVAMLLLGISDVHEADIIENYETTWSYIRRNPKIQENVKHTTKDVFLSKAEWMETVLTYIVKNYGGISQYVCALGFTPKEIDALKKRLITGEA